MFVCVSAVADLIVGAFGADKAVLYRYGVRQTVNVGNFVHPLSMFLSVFYFETRARPIVNATGSLTVQPTMLNPEEKTCELHKGEESVAVSWYVWESLSVYWI